MRVIVVPVAKMRMPGLIMQYARFKYPVYFLRAFDSNPIWDNYIHTLQACKSDVYDVKVSYGYENVFNYIFDNFPEDTRVHWFDDDIFLPPYFEIPQLHPIDNVLIHRRTTVNHYGVIDETEPEQYMHFGAVVFNNTALQQAHHKMLENGVPKNELYGTFLDRHTYDNMPTRRIAPLVYHITNPHLGTNMDYSMFEEGNKLWK